MLIHTEPLFQNNFNYLKSWKIKISQHSSHQSESKQGRYLSIFLLEHCVLHYQIRRNSKICHKKYLRSINNCRKVFELCSKDKIGKLGKGHEYNLEHEEEGNHIRGTS